MPFRIQAEQKRLSFVHHVTGDVPSFIRADQEKIAQVLPLRDERPIRDVSGLEELPPQRILLAEDNRINRMFVSMMLTEAGHHVVNAGNGQEAVNDSARRG